MQIGFIGLGLIGTPMAKHIVQKNPALMVWNRTAEKCQPLIALGATHAANAKELIQQVDLLILCVTDENSVKDILFNDNVLADAKPNLIIVDHSTICPDTSKEIAAQVALSNQRFLDAPITGGVAGTEAGTLNIFVGGDEQAFTKAHDVLTCYAGKISHMGDSGTGQMTKLCNQEVTFTFIMAIYEMIAFAKKNKLDLNKLFNAFDNNLFDSKLWRILSTAALSTEEQHTAHIKTFMKDLNYIQHTAKKANASTPLNDAVFKLVTALIDRGMAEDDMTDMIKAFED
jgi:3-hydroxyisobutyrate dehydrogenase-like beta-hydroxyacid dehydrogenase